MGISDRDYERQYDTGSGWRDPGGPGLGFGGFGSWSATGKLLLALAAVYVAQLAVRPLLTDLFELRSDWFRQPWRVVTLASYGFLHDPSNIGHLLFNALGIFFFGRAVEQRYGSREFITFFVSAVVFAGVVWSVAGLVADQQRAATLVGASGGIAAIVVLFALCYPHVEVLFMGFIPTPAWMIAVLFVAGDLYGALYRAEASNVAYSAHLAGALFGFVYHRFGWRLSDLLPGAGAFKLSKLKSRPKLRVHREDPEQETSEDRVDEILRKIQERGQASLTRDEKRILEEASRRYQKRKRD
ncbi:MAG: rhomboid family intramembrane serine protease [Lacipirellulaceae bacterium]